MFNKNKILCILLTFVLCLIITLFFLLSTNKTFFKNTYNSLNNQEIFIPKYSYLKEPPTWLESLWGVGNYVQSL